MRKFLSAVVLLFALAIPANASEISAPPVPQSGQIIMPENTESFGSALFQLIRNSVDRILPDLTETVRICIQLLVTSLLCSLLSLLPNRSGRAASVGSVVIVFLQLVRNTDTLIRLASDTVREICEYGKLLCPVMTAALSAQGAITSSSALYMGTTVFSALLGAFISRVFIPMVYAFLAFTAANSALGEDYLKKLADSIKNTVSWFLKTLMVIFTTYMSVTGVVTGTTDAAALKAAKVTFSSVVPVVGGILSDASEAVLVSMGLVKNATGIYGILASVAVFIGPFMKVGLQYLGLKASALLCSIFATKNIASLINDLAAALGLLLAMLASACTMVLISTVCFLKGAS